MSNPQSEVEIEPQRHNHGTTAVQATNAHRSYAIPLRATRAAHFSSFFGYSGSNMGDERGISDEEMPQREHHPLQRMFPLSCASHPNSSNVLGY